MAEALQNIKVIDLSRILAGPWASQMLADMGANVIKIERPVHGDDTRHWGPPFVNTRANDTAEQSSYFHCANRNKQSIAVDITCLAGQNIVKTLLKEADVFIENYKVGGLKKYGLSYEQVKEINPRLVYCSITGFGQSGPYAHKAGYDAMIQGEGGLMSITGEPDGEPMKVGVAVVDVTTGLYCANAILAALLARNHMHEGQHIDVALLDVQVAMLANQGMNYLSTGSNPQRLGNAHPNIVPYQTFATHNGRLILAIGNDKQFEKFCKAAGCEALAVDPRFKLNHDRVKNRKILVPILTNTLRQHTTEHWVQLLESISVPCGPVNTIEQAFNHPQILHRKIVRKVPDKNGEMIETVASPINFSKTPIMYEHAAPCLGEHSRKVLHEECKLEQEKITELIEQGVIGQNNE